jgi:outer membrane protein OmpU
MNTIKKIGLTALGTSLVASSAIAADFSVSGDAGYTWKSKAIGTTTNDGIGFNHDISISGSGEMENGWTVGTNMIFVEDTGMSSTHVKLTMGSMGSIKIGNGTGGIGAGFDDATPRAYEENHDGMATTTVIDSIGSQMANGQISYSSPSMDIGGASVVFHYEYANEADATAVLEGAASGGASKGFDVGHGAGLNIGYGGLSIGAYANEAKKDGGQSVSDHDRSAGTYFINYTMGPVSIGYQTGFTERGVGGAADTATTAAKTVAAATGNFEFEKIGVAFNMSDNFSVSYGDLTETYDSQDDGTVANVDMDSTSIQFSYTMGSMSISGYQTDTDNPGWDSDASSDEITELAVNFAF